MVSRPAGEGRGRGHAVSMRTTIAALAITAGSLFSGSGTSSPPFTALAVMLPIGSEALTLSRSTCSGRWTPIVTSTSSLVLVDLQRTDESERAVMQRILHGAQRGLGVVGAVQIVAGAHFKNN